MAYALGDYVSYRQVDAHIVFLDLRADRYTCLGPDAASRFAQWLADGGLAPLGTIGLASLERHKLIVAREQAGRLGPCRHPTPATSLYDDVLVPTGAIETIRAMRSLAIAAARLRRRPLLDTVVGVAGMDGTQADAGDAIRLRSIVAAHRRLALLTTEHGSCLLRSSALAAHLSAKAIAFRFVFGVKLGAFAAHCWLERDGLILNDTQEHVCAFKPILAI